jgi:hypothetical protein
MGRAKLDRSYRSTSVTGRGLTLLRALDVHPDIVWEEFIVDCPLSSGTLVRNLTMTWRSPSPERDVFNFGDEHRRMPDPLGRDETEHPGIVTPPAGDVRFRALPFESGRAHPSRSRRYRAAEDAGRQDPQPKPEEYDNRGLGRRSPLSRGIGPGEWPLLNARFGTLNSL